MLLECKRFLLGSNLRRLQSIMMVLLVAFGGLLAAAPLPSAHACNTCSFLATWGSKGSGNGQFNNPVGVAVDGSGNVYVTDALNSRVQLFGDPTSGSSWSDMLQKNSLIMIIAVLALAVVLGVPALRDRGRPTVAQ